ncbi:GtrA-like protein [uncultured Flavonifractor sp.]|nr:GtrA-like protein [uncultured Flavonifractor sp.]
MEEAKTRSGGNPWTRFRDKHPGIAQFLVFFMLSNGITVLQMIIMPLFKSLFGMTDLVNTTFQILPVGHNFDGSVYYIFNYPAGAIADGGGGGLAYFLAVQVTLLIAQVINFFAQRNVTFKSKSSMGKAACWYLVAYVAITLIAAALQGLYKAPVYQFFMETLNMGAAGETTADLITMLINCIISFWVYFPILKIIFRK